MIIFLKVRLPFAPSVDDASSSVGSNELNPEMDDCVKTGRLRTAYASGNIQKVPTNGTNAVKSVGKLKLIIKLSAITWGCSLHRQEVCIRQLKIF